MAMIIKGTTPTFLITFDTIDPENIEVAYLVIKQNGKVKVEKPLSDASIVEEEEYGKCLEWTLTQEESLTLFNRKDAEVHCDWVLNDGTRGASVPGFYDIVPGGKEEVI